MTAALSCQAREAADAAARLAARDVALCELAALLNPTRGRSLWSVAAELAALLRRFETTARPRIVAGHRAPRGPESSLLALCIPECPRSAGRLFRLLQELAAD